MGNQIRCDWSLGHPSMIAYHDTEWGVPVHDDRKLFEFLVLDAAQAGLSWRTVLLKRENYRKAFDNFDAEKVARFTEKRVAKLLQNPGIIRNRLKVREEFSSLDRYLWQFVDGQPRINRFQSMKQIPATSKESDAMSKNMKQRGFTFCGSTICYAFMQAAGLVNDHLLTCFRHREVQGR